jgi:hypothetical protein
MCTTLGNTTKKGGTMPSIGPTEVLMFGVIALLFVWPWCRIFAKAGYPAWYGLSLLVPVLNLVGLLYLAFAEWPSRQESHHVPGLWDA